MMMKPRYLYRISLGDDVLRVFEGTEDELDELLLVYLEVLHCVSDDRRLCVDVYERKEK